MPAVLVHGVPDTYRMWDAVRSHLRRRDVITPSLPGFGCPIPAGFDASKEAYVDWLVGELEVVGEPVDLVGHDWGALLVQRVVSLRPDLIRTWACGDGPADRDYVWHDAAQQFQTPGLGEQIVAMMTAETFVPALVELGIPLDAARDSAGRIDATMRDCILRLYRSAVHVGEEWQPGVEKITRPALILWSANDLFVSLEFGSRLAARVRGELVVFEGCGHWWPYERPAEVAQALERFWAAHA